MSIIKNIVKVAGYIILLLLIYILYKEYTGIVNGYSLVDYGHDDAFIMKYNRRIVGADIVSYDEADGYIVGLRIPNKYLDCVYYREGKPYHHYRMASENEEEYFILNTNNRLPELKSYLSIQDFNKRLEKLSIKEKINLDYSRFSGNQEGDSFNSDKSLGDCTPMDPPE